MSSRHSLLTQPYVMPNTVGLIPRNRLIHLPEHLRLAHEYCFFLHDECVHLLRQYEGARAHFVNCQFQTKTDMEHFTAHADANGALDAMRFLGFEAEAKRLVMNNVTMAMCADSVNHIFEGLRCLEKRKLVVALNLLRKPLTDSLVYLSWMLSAEDSFYASFSTNSPQGLTDNFLHNNRSQYISDALAQTELAEIFSADYIQEKLFSRSNSMGLQRLFQHAVHLITNKYVELKTTPENFNFIFRDPLDDDLYDLIYDALPVVLAYFAHVTFCLFERIVPPDPGAKKAFQVRSILGLYLSIDGNENLALERLQCLNDFKCEGCGQLLKLTRRNAAKIVLTESFRCTGCRKNHSFPFSWLF